MVMLKNISSIIFFLVYPEKLKNLKATDMFWFHTVGVRNSYAEECRMNSVLHQWDHQGQNGASL